MKFYLCGNTAQIIFALLCLIFTLLLLLSFNENNENLKDCYNQLFIDTIDKDFNFQHFDGTFSISKVKEKNDDFDANKRISENYDSAAERGDVSVELKEEKFVSDSTRDGLISNKYTIVVSTYNRDNELVKNVDHWISCPHVHQVQIVWHDPEREPPKMLQKMQKEYNCTGFPKLLIRRQTKDMLSNRFRAPESGFKTEAVFNIDDDAVIDCNLMTAAFAKWKELGEHSMVGFEPRQIDWNGEGQGYKWWSSCEEDSCEYNTLWPTKGAFLHKKFYDVFFTEAYAEVRHLVDKFFTGEDILMTFVHFSEYMKLFKKTPPILSVQAATGFGFVRKFYDNSNRFSLLQKLLNFPEVVMFRSGIGEITSLGLRSSWHRGRVTESIGKLSKVLFGGKDFEYETPPMTDEWFFLFPNNTGFSTKKVCGTDLFQSLECTTKNSLTPLSNRDAELITIFMILLCILGFLVIKSYVNYKRRNIEYEKVRVRKVSMASPYEYAANGL